MNQRSLTNTALVIKKANDFHGKKFSAKLRNFKAKFDKKEPFFRWQKNKKTQAFKKLCIFSPKSTKMYGFSVL
jgi:hypothetical protein